MVLLAQIEKVVRQEMTDKKTGQVGQLVQIVLSDKTKPSRFRASTFFVTYMSPEKFVAQFGTSDPVDERVTVAVSEMAAMNALIKVKGQLLKGWLSNEELERLQEVSEAPLPSPVQTAPAPAKKAA